MIREWIFAGMFIIALCCAASGQEVQVSCEATQFGTVGPIPWDTQPAAGVWCIASRPGARVFAITVEFEVAGAKRSVKALVEANEQGSAMWPFVLAARVGDFRYVGVTAKAYVEPPAVGALKARPEPIIEVLRALAERRYAVCVESFQATECSDAQTAWLRAGNEALRSAR